LRLGSVLLGGIIERDSVAFSSSGFRSGRGRFVGARRRKRRRSAAVHLRGDEAERRRRRGELLILGVVTSSILTIGRGSIGLLADFVLCPIFLLGGCLLLTCLDSRLLGSRGVLGGIVSGLYLGLGRVKVFLLVLVHGCVFLSRFGLSGVVGLGRVDIGSVFGRIR
jgi:hypothetical protein